MIKGLTNILWCGMIKQDRREVFILTDKEVKKLKRAELMELFYYMKKEIDHLTEENQQLREDKQQLSDALNVTKVALEKIELFSKISAQSQQQESQEENQTLEKTKKEKSETES